MCVQLVLASERLPQANLILFLNYVFVVSLRLRSNRQLVLSQLPSQLTILLLGVHVIADDVLVFVQSLILHHTA